MTSVSAWDLKYATLEDDLEKVDTLNYSRRGIADLGAVIRLKHLKHLTLCFNQLRHLGPLTSLQELQHLDVSHNKLSAVAGLEALTAITSLNLGYNKLAQISQVYSLPSLQQLCLHSNRISEAAVVQELSNLKKLQRLSLGNNPVNNQVSNWKAATVDILPGLQVLDRLILKPSNAEGSQGICLSGVSLSPSGPDSSINNSSHNPSVDSDSISAGAEGAADSSLVGGQGQASSRGAAVCDAPVNSGPGSSAGRLQRQGTVQDNLADTWKALAERQQQAAAVTGKAVHGVPRLKSGEAAAPELQAGRKPAKAASQEDQASFQDVAGSLPSIEKPTLKPSMLLPPQKGPHRSESSSTGGYDRKKPAREILTLKYPEGKPGVSVRSDGSAFVYWPSGSVAATLDPEDAVTTSKYRLLAMYAPSGNVAATFDSSGGFLQHVSGALMLVWNRRDGQGSLYSAERALQARWSRQQAKTMQDMSAALGPNMQAVFRPLTGELLLTFSCKGISVTLSTMQGPVLQQQQEPGSHASLSAAAASQVSADAGSAQVKDSARESKKLPSATAAVGSGSENAVLGGEEQGSKAGQSVGAEERGGLDRESMGNDKGGERGGDDGGGSGNSEVSALLARAKALMMDTEATEAQEAAAAAAAGGAL